jgi:hypothetical protein
MAGERSRYGLVVSALGAVVLIVSLFLPWYGLSFTPTGIAFAQQTGERFLTQFGNAAAQAQLGSLHANLAGLAGQQFVSVDAHQAFKSLSIVIIALAGIALLDALFPLARAAGAIPDGAGRSVVLLGIVCGALVAFRMIDRPSPAGSLIALSLREGAWLALLGSLTMVIGGLWPRYQHPVVSGGEARSPDPFATLSGWTPQG